MKHTKEFVLSILLLFSGVTANAQCDFVNDITGLSQSVLPAGLAADPLLFTQTYVLVDDSGIIVATNSTPDFFAVTPGLYTIHAVNYDINETAAVAPLLVVGANWNGIENYVGCLDYTGAYDGCFQSVCDEITELETATTTNIPSGFNTNSANTQEYCLVCNGVVQGINTTGSFDLTLFPAAIAGADCEVVAMNYFTADGAPMAVGDNFNANASAKCGDCWDFLARNLEITSVLPVEFIGLTGRVDGSWNRLDWSTLSEINNDKFIIERSQDGMSFERIGEVDGAGNSMEQLDYVFFDRKPSANLEYYRIRQFDFDGTVKITPLVKIQRTDIIEFNVYPNPVDDDLIVTLSSEDVTQGTISVLDAKGNVVLIEDFNCSMNNLCEKNLSMAEYASGMYCILVQDNLNGHSYQKRLVKR